MAGVALAAPMLLGAARTVRAGWFMRRELRWNLRSIYNGVRGVDVSMPVRVRMLPVGHRAIQYVRINGRVGQYFGPPGAMATELGVM